MRRSKIVCTLGPAVDSHEQLVALIEAGMSVARFNFSHGSHAEHQGRYDRVRKAAAETGRAVGVLADLQGPKIRLAKFAEGPVELVRGDEFVITAEDVPGDKSICGTTYKGLPGDVAKGDPILINDGNVELKVVSVDGPRVHTIVIEGGVISDHKGINLPGAAVNVPALSEKDVEDLRFALRMGCDLVALSFVRDANDIKDVHKVMDEEGRRVPVIAKVEKPQAVEHMEGIVMAFDGVMVARGDLAVEYPLERVPMVQKRLVELCRRNAKPVVVATQMMESMITNSRPTRAEASDVANAILDGADAVMLSAESSVGAYPIETVKTMSKIVVAAEQELLSRASSRWSRARSPVPRAVRSPARPARSPTSWAARPWSPSPSPATPPAVCPAIAPRSRSWPSPRTSPPATSWPSAGASRPMSSRTSTTRTRWSTWSTRSS